MVQSTKLKISIYWSESNSWIYFLYLIKNWKIYCFEQSFTGLGPEECSSLQGLVIRTWLYISFSNFHYNLHVIHVYISKDGWKWLCFPVCFHKAFLVIRTTGLDTSFNHKHHPLYALHIIHIYAIKLKQDLMDWFLIYFEDPGGSMR